MSSLAALLCSFHSYLNILFDLKFNFQLSVNQEVYHILPYGATENSPISKEMHDFNRTDPNT